MDEEDDFYFQSDTFDTLPTETLQALETQAINRSQNRSQSRGVAPPSHKKDIELDDGTLDDEDIIDLDAAPHIIPRLARPAINLTHRNDLGSTSNSLHDDEVLRQDFGRRKDLGAIQDTVPFLGVNGKNVQSQTRQGYPLPTEPTALAGSDKEALYDEIRALKLEREDILRTNRDAQTALQTKAGETALLRRKLEALKSESEKRVQLMQEQHKQVLSEQHNQLEIALRDKKQLETNNRFLENDLKQNRAEITKPINKKTDSDTRSRSFDALTVTPRKSKPRPFGDGFGDGDVVIISPSRSKDKVRQVTPKKTEKRKRSTEQSPAQLDSLEFESNGLNPPAAVIRSDSINSVSTLQPSTTSDDNSAGKVELLQLLLNHRYPKAHDTFIEVLSAHSLPSNPSQKLSYLVTYGLQTSPPSNHYSQSAIQVLLSVWRRCLEESYYVPLNALIDGVKFIVALQDILFASQFATDMVPLLMRTIDLITVPIGEACSKGTYVLTEEAIKCRNVIEVKACLELLSNISRSCAQAEAQLARKHIPRGNKISIAVSSTAKVFPLQTFWQSVAFDFPLVLLMRTQPLHTIRCMLMMLSTSCLNSTFGTIHSDSTGAIYWDSQRKHETDLVERLVQLLFEQPRPLQSQEEWPPEDIARLRLLVLDLFMAMCMTGASPSRGQVYGGQLLAGHTKVVGSLFRFLNDSLNLLYINPPDLGDRTSTIKSAATGGGSTSVNKLISNAINKTVRIVHHLLTKYGSSIDIRQRLAAIHGGTHKHLVGLARLAFSDQLVMEAGIEDAVCEAAHEILDGFLTFEEGESLIEIFSTPPTKKGSATDPTSDTNPKLPVRRKDEWDEEMNLDE